MALSLTTVPTISRRARQAADAWKNLERSGCCTIGDDSRVGKEAMVIPNERVRLHSLLTIFCGSTRAGLTKRIFFDFHGDFENIRF
jgi:hypothetical protein